MKEFKLCFIQGNKAWFTDNIKAQWGDDWNDKPYECNAGEPYNEYMFNEKFFPLNHKCLYFDNLKYAEPLTIGLYSVEEINNHYIPWLILEDDEIYAGTSYETFKNKIIKAGGKIYEEDFNYEFAKEENHIPYID